MITIKLDIGVPIETQEMILKYQNQYSNLLHVYYNRLIDGYSQTQCKHLDLNNVDMLNSWIAQSCVFEANSLVSKSKHIVFGGMKNFKSRMNDLISNDEFKKNRLSQIYSIGEPLKNGNRLFKIIDVDTIVFKPHKNEHYELKLKCRSKKYRRYIELLMQH